jgi:hypothetical protein
MRHAKLSFITNDIFLNSHSESGLNKPKLIHLILLRTGIGHFLDADVAPANLFGHRLIGGMNLQSN